MITLVNWNGNIVSSGYYITLQEWAGTVIDTGYYFYCFTLPDGKIELVFSDNKNNISIIDMIDTVSYLNLTAGIFNTPISTDKFTSAIDKTINTSNNTEFNTAKDFFSNLDDNIKNN